MDVAQGVATLEYVYDGSKVVGNCAPSANSKFTNGSFEDSIVETTQEWDGLPVGTTGITGWKVSKTTVDYVVVWPASHGTHSIDLDGNSGDAGGIEQTFATSPSHSYRVTFDLAGNPEGLPVVKTLRVSAAGQSSDYTFDTTGKNDLNLGWTPQTFTFVANASSTTLEFLSLDSPAYAGGPVIDNVSVVE